MTGVDVEHTKALAAKFDPAAPSQYLAKLGREVVAAVERVQALHSPAVDSELQSTYCLGCDAPWPCDTRKALETPK